MQYVLQLGRVPSGKRNFWDLSYLQHAFRGRQLVASYRSHILLPRPLARGSLDESKDISLQYQIILNAAGWLEKGVLEETDLSQIETAINAQYAEENLPITEE